MQEKFQSIMERLEKSRFAPLLQFVKFGLVGISNTAISWGIEMLCYYLLMRDAQFDSLRGLLGHLGVAATAEQVRITVVTAIAFIVSVTNSFYWNSRYVFRGENQKTKGEILLSYFRTMASYALTGLILSPAIKIWLSGMGVPYYLASILSLVVTIPLNFVLNKFWAFRESK
ncbi:MAG: GtrA family protein [Clostridia bacterium]|nr:GtrA family protein [Clostridia bacterium]